VLTPFDTLRANGLGGMIRRKDLSCASLLLLILHGTFPGGVKAKNE